MRKRIGLGIGSLVTLYACYIYINGEVLNALFWMSVASAALIITTSVKE